MQGLQVVSRNSSAGGFGLSPACRIELLKAFHLGHCSDTCFKQIPLAEV